MSSSKHSNIISWLTLNRFSLDNLQGISRLVEKYHDPDRIFHLNLEEFKSVEGINKMTYKRLKKYYAVYYKEAEAEYARLSSMETGVVALSDELYPELLKNIYDPPLVLYYRGDVALLSKKKTVAIVGSRFASLYGRNVAQTLAKQLAQNGIVIVSGMARGIDSFAHAGALETGTTCAVLGSGIDKIYPPENRVLYNKIVDNGVVVSEYPLGTMPKKFNFPRRNRIISGLSLGSAVIEAAKRSGSLITANFAMEQGRDVFAVPGEVGTRFSEGTNNLIKQGAKLVSNYKDILDALEFDTVQTVVPNPTETVQTDLSHDEKAILDFLNSDVKTVNDILNSMDMPVHKIESALLMLELKNLIKQDIGKKYRRC